MSRQWKRKYLAGILAAVTILQTAFAPLTGYAAETKTAETEPPSYEEVKELLDEGEVVTAADHEVLVGDPFDAETDFSGLEISDDTKVKVTLHEAKNSDGEDFHTGHADTYKAVYYVEPLTSGHPVYQVSRNIIVKEPDVQAQSQSAETGGQESESGAESEDGEADPQIETESEPESEPYTENQAETQTELEGKTEEELDAALEAAEEQDTVDEESGLTLGEVMTQAVEQDVDLVSLDAGESVMFMAAASARAAQSVTVTKEADYYYADYGLGSYVTCPYTVTFGSVTATAYCVQPSKPGPGTGVYTIEKLGDAKNLAKVCYYGTKASGENGYFAEYHPDFSAGKQFIITHLAVSYANGSGDAFYGTNATGQALAMELYNYCISQPEIPDVEMSFSNASPKAYLDGDTQRTEEITFQASELQTITMKLPKGVKLHNVTTGKTSAAGASVELSGGTKFYLTAPLTQAQDAGASWSSTMKGSITKDYSAYKITTGESTQDLALVFGEGVDDEKYVDFQVTWLKDATVELIKKDKDTNANLAGAVFGIYSDEACTKLIAQMPATDANGASKATIGKTQDTVYLKEITAPNGYAYDAKAYGVELSIGKTVSQTVTNERVKATLHLKKRDKETGTQAQGDASLEGAVYGLYAREDITHPDGKTGVLYAAGTQMATLTTDKEGNASVEGLYLGKYYVKELTPPVGYVLDEAEYDVEFVSTDGKTKVIEQTAISNEQVIKQPFQVIKAANNGKTDADLLEGAGFTAYLKSSLKVNEDGSYDFSSADPVVLTEDGSTEMFTDEKGYACSIPLPYGTYVVRETTTPQNFKPVDDFIVEISENHPDEPQVWRVLLDEEFSAKLKIIKKDDETKQTVLLADTEFKVFDMDKNSYVEQVTTYPTTTVHASYFTDEDGYLILPENLPCGHYRIEEVQAPDGYTLNENYVEISVDQNTAYQTDPVSGDIIIEVTYENHPAKGKLTISKKGEVVSGFDGDFTYEEKTLAGAKFEVYAAEDIYTPDHQKDGAGNRHILYAKDTLVTTVTTDETGKAVIENLPLGKYRVEEKTAPSGFVLQADSQEITLAYAGQDTPVVEGEVSFTNDRQKVSLSVEKQDSETGTAVAGAVFGIYNKEDILSGGKVLVEKDTLLQKVTSNERGEAACTLDLPLGKYYVKELEAPAGYVSSDEVLEFDASYQGQDIQVVELSAVKKNEPTTVEVTKSDITTGVELDGASLSVLDKDGNVVDSWTSVKDEPHVIKRLVVGETYILREEFAPYGYLKTTDVEFTITDTAEVQKVEMKDEVPTALLIVNKKGEFLDKVTLLDNLKGTVEHLFEYVTGNLTDVTFEVYAAEAIKAADGVSENYYEADELVATIKTDANGVAKAEELPVGKYYVKEVGTAYGYVLDEEPRYVDLSYRDQDTPVVVYDEDWQNNRQKVTVHVLKKEKDGDRVLKGGIFGLFTKEDILSASGNVLMEADTLIELKTTGDDGKIAFVADLPLDGKYYVKEIYAPDGFVTTEEVQEFTTEYQGDKLAEAVFEFTFENEPTKVEISKTDITGKEELPGAKLTILDKDGNVVESWTSTTEPHYIEELPVGSYTLREEQAPEGYVMAEDVSFEVENTGEIQKVHMEDDYTMGRLTVKKTDSENGVALAGVEFEIRNKVTGEVVGKLVTDQDGKAESELLPIGVYENGKMKEPIVYVLAETKPLDGYQANTKEEEIVFTWEDQKTAVIEVTKEITNTREPGTPAPTAPKTGDTTNIWIPVLAALLALAGIIVVLVRMKRRKR